VLSLHWSGGTKESHRKYELGYAVCRRGFEVAPSEQSRLNRTYCSSVRCVLFNDDLLIIFYENGSDTLGLDKIYGNFMT
jgi:hypothetical protein